MCLPAGLTPSRSSLPRASVVDRQIISAASGPLVRAVCHAVAMTWRNRGAAVALAALLIGGCSAAKHPDTAASGSPVTSTPTAGPQAAAHGAEAAINTIPWTQVGPGWLLATWSQVPGRRPGGGLTPGGPTPATATTTLYLVDPA